MKGREGECFQSPWATFGRSQPVTGDHVGRGHWERSGDNKNRKKIVHTGSNTYLGVRSSAGTHLANSCATFTSKDRDGV